MKVMYLDVWDFLVSGVKEWAQTGIVFMGGCRKMEKAL
jgi:hypothetical protein